MPVRAAHGVERRCGVSEYLNLLIGLAMALNLLALGSSRLPTLIAAMAMQGVTLGVMPLLIEEHPDWRVVMVALATMAGKGLVIPTLLTSLLRAGLAMGAGYLSRTGGAGRKARGDHLFGTIIAGGDQFHQHRRRSGAIDPCRMAAAFQLAVQAGRMAFETGMASESFEANPTSPLTAFLDQP